MLAVDFIVLYAEAQPKTGRLEGGYGDSEGGSEGLHRSACVNDPKLDLSGMVT